MGYESFHQNIANKKRLKELETENAELRKEVESLKTELELRKCISEIS